MHSFPKKTLFFLLFLVAFNLKAKLVDKIKATVSTTVILKSDADKLYKDLSSNKQLRESMKLTKKDVTKDKVLDLLIEEAIITETLKKDGSSITTEEINKQLNFLAQNYGLTVESLKKNVEAQNLNFEIYKQNIKKQIARRKVFEKYIRQTVTPPTDQELKTVYNQKAEEQFFISSWSEKKNSANLKMAKKLTNSKYADTKEAMSEIGWVSPSTLNPKFQKALKTKNSQGFTKPVLVDGNYHVLHLLKSRLGSDEDFAAKKNSLVLQSQEKSFESSFQNWIAQKRNDMEINVHE